MLTGDDMTKAEQEQRVSSYDPTEYWAYWHDRSIQVIAAREAKKWEADEDVLPVRKRKRESKSPPAERGKRLNTQISSTTTPVTTDHATSSLHQPIHEPRKGLRTVVTNNKPVKTDQTPSTLHQPIPELPYNPYEGTFCAKQLDESLEDFLSRLPPSTTTIPAAQSPWIYIANPHSKDRPASQDIAGLRTEGTHLLAEYMSEKAHLEKTHPDKSELAIIRLLTRFRADLERSLFSLAKDKRVTSGKWMLFLHPSQVDRVWSVIAKATLQGRLGSAAKVAVGDSPSPGRKSDGPSQQRLLCVYTSDFSDRADVTRALEEMKSLGLVQGGGFGLKPIYYKADVYTYLDLSSGNAWKLKASLYCSKDLLGK